MQKNTTEKYNTKIPHAEKYNTKILRGKYIAQNFHTQKIQHINTTHHFILLYNTHTTQTGNMQHIQHKNITRIKYIYTTQKLQHGKYNTRNTTPENQFF